MNPAVEEYLRKKEDEELEKASLKAEEEDAAYKAYRTKVIKAAKLFEENVIEVDRSTYEYNYSNQVRVEKDENNQKHYFIKGKSPIELTDEEFSAVEKTFTPEQLAGFRNASAPEKTKKEESSWAAGFCTGIAYFLFIGGFIVAIIAGSQTAEFSFTVFLTTLGTYVIAGCFALCMRELFTQLQRIVSLLQEKKSRS